MMEGLKVKGKIVIRHKRRWTWTRCDDEKNNFLYKQTDGPMKGQIASDSRVAFVTVNPQELTFLLQCS